MTVCRHFGTCGGCLFQDMPDEAYRAMKRENILRALSQHGFSNPKVEDTAEVPPRTRRRATLKVAKRVGETVIGFHARQSHNIVDMRECFVLTPALTSLIQKMRPMFMELLADGDNTEFAVTESNNGFDLSLHWSKPIAPARNAIIARWAQELGIARVSAGRDVLVELAAPVVRLGDFEVKLPRDSFLQPTRSGEAALQSHVMSAAKGARRLADLFAGCGTFSLVLARQARVHAVEQDQAMLSALEAAARTTQGLKPVTVEKRDLFRRPLTADELNRFDAVVLDPPRSGALEQVRELARSRVRRVIYVSCNPQSFARDARVMVDGGHEMGQIIPVDQFLWSAHTELVGTFSRARR